MCLFTKEDVIKMIDDRILDLKTHREPTWSDDVLFKVVVSFIIDHLEPPKDMEKELLEYALNQFVLNEEFNLAEFLSVKLKE